MQIIQILQYIKWKTYNTPVTMGILKLVKSRNIHGNGDYINVKLGTIHGNVDINADYGSL